MTTKHKNYPACKHVLYVFFSIVSMENRLLKLVLRMDAIMLTLVENHRYASTCFVVIVGVGQKLCHLMLWKILMHLLL